MKKVDLLIRAAEEGNVQALAGILDVNPGLATACDGNGWTGLHRAAQFGHVGAANLLILRGAKVNAKDERGWTPLHNAATGYLDTLPVMAALVLKGSNLEARNSERLTPLGVCVQYSNLPGLSLLLAKGAKAHWKDENGKTLIELAESVLAAAGDRKFADQRTDLKEMIELLRISSPAIARRRISK